MAPVGFSLSPQIDKGRDMGAVIASRLTGRNVKLWIALAVTLALLLLLMGECEPIRPLPDGWE